MEKIPDGEIFLDSPFAKEIGFTSDVFEGMSYLWKTGEYIIISAVWVKEERKGNFTKLTDKIFSLGYKIKVPTPFPKMVAWLKKNSFHLTYEKDKNFDCAVEIWISP